MKRFLLLIIAVNLLIPASAHKYLQQGLSWQRTHYERVWDYTLNKDTVIGGKHYLSGEWLGLYRDDETGIYMYRNSCNEEMLVFPYGAQVGDTLHISNLSLILPCDTLQQGITPGWGDYYGVVTSVDTVTLLNGEQRRRIFYSGGRHNWYIEGIGGLKGWRCETVDWELDDTDVWLCYYIDSTLIWASNDCEQWQSKYPTACLGYTPLKTATTWHCVEAYYDFPSQAMTEFTAVTYSLQGDTIFGGTIYQTLRRGDGAYCGALRQSADGQQVFYRPGELGGLYQPSKGKEYLLYDFGVSVGDTVYAYDGFMDTSCEQADGYSVISAWKVLSVDTIDGRRHIQVEGGNHQSRVEWIEGIGTCNLLFSRTMHCLTGYTGTWTLCAADSKGNTLYSYNVDHLGIHNDCPTWRLIDDALPSLPSDNALNRKFLRDGHICIETPLGTFDATGRKAE